MNVKPKTVLIYQPAAWLEIIGIEMCGILGLLTRNNRLKIMTYFGAAGQVPHWLPCSTPSLARLRVLIS